MDFARKQLEKYGWTDGKGLGKHENGISEALKPKLKRSVAGIGHDAAADFTEHWWTTLYNKAAGNVQVEEKNGKTKMIKTKDDEFKITNSTWRLNKKSKDSDEQDEYSEYFVRKAVLLSGGSKTANVNADSESEEEMKNTKDVTNMTDEELFAACGGRTAHKGARHGLKATGKLARIQRQEQMLLSQPQYNDYSHAKKNRNKNFSVNDLVIEDVSLNSDTDYSEIKKKKNKRKHCLSKEDNFTETVKITEHCYESVKEIDSNPIGNIENDIEIENNTDKELKKSKRKAVETMNENNSSVTSKNKKKKNKNSEDSEELRLIVNDNVNKDFTEHCELKVKTNKKNKSNNNSEEIEIFSNDNIGEDSDLKVKTNKKKKINQNSEATEEIELFYNANVGENEPEVKKNKKKKMNHNT